MSTTSLNDHFLGLLGAGNMAEALAHGVIKSGALPPERIMASDVSADRRAAFKEKLGVTATADNASVLAAADLLVICVKPQQVGSLLAEIGPLLDPRRHLVASICAGVPTARIEKDLPAETRVVRVMPNTPMLVGLGASCMSPGRQARDEDLALIEALFEGASLTLRVEENMLDAVTGLSGSGPAYLFYLVEAMCEAGVAEGFSAEQAALLAQRTVAGAARMLEQTGLSAVELRRRVTSPNGTTQAAIESLEAGGVKEKIVAAIRRAAERSRELGRKSLNAEGAKKT